MPWHDHYFILNADHQPVEVTSGEYCRWISEHGVIAHTEVGPHARVTTRFSGMTDDVTMPGPPKFTHFVEGPGLKDKTADTPTYEEALARHERIVEWLRKRVARYEAARDE
jgi:hypothetical protein